MKVKIILKAKKDFGSIKKGQNLVMENNVFDAMNGIAFFSIDRSVWGLVDYLKCSGFKDKNGKEIFEKDYVEALVFPLEGEHKCKVFGSVIFDEGCFCIDIIKIDGKNCGYDVGNKIPLFDFISVQIVSV